MMSAYDPEWEARVREADLVAEMVAITARRTGRFHPAIRSFLQEADETLPWEGPDRQLLREVADAAMAAGITAAELTQLTEAATGRRFLSRRWAMLFRGVLRYLADVRVRCELEGQITDTSEQDLTVIRNLAAAAGLNQAALDDLLLAELDTDAEHLSADEVATAVDHLLDRLAGGSR